MCTKKKQTLSLVIWIIFLLLISSGIGKLTQASMYPWYHEISRSMLTPPGYVFGIVWPVLYVLIAISGWTLWKHRNLPELKPLRIAFIIQLIINWLWTPFFFYFHWIGIGLLCIGLIIALVTLIMIRALKNMRVVSWLLLPYWLWSLFAFYLNFFIWSHN
jgi:tryptophan-rich sensory protein